MFGLVIRLWVMFLLGRFGSLLQKLCLLAGLAVVLDYFLLLRQMSVYAEVFSSGVALALEYRLLFNRHVFARCNKRSNR